MVGELYVTKRLAAYTRSAAPKAGNQRRIPPARTFTSLEALPCRNKNNNSTLSGLELVLRAVRFGPVEVVELAAGLVGPFIGVGAKEIALRLEQVGRQPGQTVAVY